MFRLWVSVGLGVLVAIAYVIIVVVLQVAGARAVRTDAQFALEFGL